MGWNDHTMPLDMTDRIIFLGTLHAIRFDSDGAAKVIVEVPASEGHKVAMLTRVTKTVLTFTVEQENQP